MFVDSEKLDDYLFEKRKKLLFAYGFSNGLIKPYDDKLLEDLRHFYCDGISIPILLLDANFSKGDSYDTASLITLGFGDDDFNVIDAEIDSFRHDMGYSIEYKNGTLRKNYFTHRFVERKKEDGTIWIYDTALGLVVEKTLYYDIENPEVLKISDKETVQKDLEYSFEYNAGIGVDKYKLPFILLELETSMIPTQKYYLERLKKEIEILKNEVDYDTICEEVKHNQNGSFEVADIPFQKKIKSEEIYF